MADLTVTFGGLKVAHLVDPAAAACGVVEWVDIGLSLPEATVQALQAADVGGLLPQPEGSDQKYTRGVVGVATGSQRYPGAAVLSVGGAGTGLVGMVRYAGGASDAVVAAHPEVVVGEGRVQAWVVGSGGADTAGPALARALEDDVPVVVDADALFALEDHADQSAQLVLTPHAGELGRMLDVERARIEAEPLRWARAAAASYDSVVLLKGRRTIIAAPHGHQRVNTTGTPWLATAGSGDVLAGLVVERASGTQTVIAVLSGQALVAAVDGPWERWLHPGDVFIVEGEDDETLRVSLDGPTSRVSVTALVPRHAAALRWVP